MHHINNNTKMKKYFQLLFIITFVFNVNSYAQIGSTCANPDSIYTLPYAKSRVSTASSGNAYNSTHICNNAYMNGNDYVFEYTPTRDMYLNISIDSMSLMGNVGLFLIQGCPDNISSICIASDTSVLTPGPSIDLAFVQSGVTYYILVSTKTPIFFGGLPFPIANTSTVFNISIMETNPYDLSVTSINGPISSCNNSSTDTIVVNITNIGQLLVDTFRIAYIFNGNSPVIESISAANLATGSSMIYRFNTTSDLSTPGTTYQIKAFSLFSLDPNPINDTANENVTHFQSINTFPYFENFEGGNSGNWTTGGTSSSWQCGRPNSMVINHASSDTTAWVTNLLGNHNAGENSYVYSPCFDFTSLASPMIELDIWYSNSFQGIMATSNASIEASTDGGTTWTVIGNTGEPVNWYNATGFVGWSGNGTNWIHAAHLLNGLAGQPNVKLRIHFDATLSIMPGFETEGFAFDNVKVLEAPASDMGITAIVSPTSGCSLGSSENITVMIKNFGFSSQSGFPVSFSVNGGALVNAIVPQTINGGDSSQFTFSANPVDMSNVATYNIKAFTSLFNDLNRLNDTSHIAIIHNAHIATYPYQEDFESNSGGWVSGGTNSSWQWGSPAGMIINSAASGVKSWVTNLTGNHNSAEVSYVTSPCFDLSNLGSPKLEAKIWYETAMSGSPFGFSKAVVMYSTDGGIQWDTLGTTGDTLNWYSGTLGGWSGNSAGWITVRHTLDVVAGQPNVMFRFMLDASMSMFPGFETEGFAFDMVKIHGCQSPEADYTYSSVGPTVTFTNSSTNGDNYSWNFDDGSSSTLPAPSHSYTETGNYNVTLYSYNSCGMDSITRNIYVNTHQGINENQNIFNVYPNPAFDFVLISSNQYFDNNNLITISDIYGKTISMENIIINNDKYSTKIDIRNFKSGIYFLSIYSKNQKYSYKIVKE